MSNKTALFGAFVAGATIGTLATYKIVKDKYEKLSKAEAESFAIKLKELRKNEASPLEDKPADDEASTESEATTPEPVRKAYERIIKDSKYVDYSAISQGKNPEPMPVPTISKEDTPQVIDPEEFGEYDDYREITLLYFTDHVLSDHDGNIVSIEEANELLGDALSRFGEYEEDAVHVRNDARKCYYEVLMEGKLYSDLLRKKPYLMNVEDEED